MNYLKLWSLGVFLCYTLAAISQKSAVVGTATDSVFYNTTVVYKADATTDMEALLSLSNSIGMGEVVRITVAPPKPAPQVASAKPVTTPTATAAQATAQNMPRTEPKPRVASTTTTTAPAKPKPVAVPQQQTIQVPKVNKTVPRSADMQVTNAQKDSLVKKKAKSDVQPVAGSPVQIKAEPIAKQTVKYAPTGTGKVKKSVVKRKSKRQANWFSPRYKNRKPGKQRYGCPKF
jgi:hypothetical protein